MCLDITHEERTNESKVLMDIHVAGYQDLSVIEVIWKDLLIHYDCSWDSKAALILK